MAHFAFGLFMLALAAVGQSAAAAEPCPRQPMPAALDSVPPLPPAGSSIGFSATPWEYPGRAWVIRAWRTGNRDGTVEIVRLRRQLDCNRWDAEARWQAPLAAAEYRALAEAVAPLGAPDGIFAPGSGEGHDLAVDGTGLAVRLRTSAWEATRQLNHYGRRGGPVSARFRTIAAKHVPAAEMPDEDWRTRRGPPPPRP